MPMLFTIIWKIVYIKSFMLSSHYIYFTHMISMWLQQWQNGKHSNNKSDTEYRMIEAKVTCTALRPRHSQRGEEIRNSAMPGLPKSCRVGAKRMTHGPWMGAWSYSACRMDCWSKWRRVREEERERERKTVVFDVWGKLHPSKWVVISLLYSLFNSK